VQQAIKETGGDFALSSARRYMVAALNELQHTQKKREKRENNFKQMQEQERVKRLRLEDARWRLKVLDDMLKAEQKLQNESKKPDSPKI
jgi:hypothetical protein